MLLLALIAPHHHHVHGSIWDYLGVAAASAASWIGLPGPGEPVLIAAAVLAARGRLDITTVVLVAWIAATAGGIAGWLIGLKAGRVVMVGRGPFRSLRIGAVARGDRVFARHPVTAILISPPWFAGIHGVKNRIYQPVNLLSAAIWAAGIGFGAYLIGPAIVEFVDDFGLATGIIVGVGVAIAVVFEIRHQRRRRARRIAAAATAGAPAAEGPETVPTLDGEDPGA
jgi:membrane protein DedA with SNARE-associated domain